MSKDDIVSERVLPGVRATLHDILRVSCRMRAASSTTRSVSLCARAVAGAEYSFRRGGNGEICTTQQSAGAGLRCEFHLRPPRCVSTGPVVVHLANERERAGVNFTLRSMGRFGSGLDFRGRN